MNVTDCYSATHRRVAKIYNELVALRLLYTVVPITKFYNIWKSEICTTFITCRYVCIRKTDQSDFSIRGGIFFNIPPLILTV